ncbi:uncharacterized protein [Pocillopora verrucosa]|uniref:uncharacterized protein isoform X1 n=1 Tax=Pocillopora verrucosa TaxID=203993 RepID=UPI0033412EE1
MSCKSLMLIVVGALLFYPIVIKATYVKAISNVEASDKRYRERVFDDVSRVLCLCFVIRVCCHTCVLFIFDALEQGFPAYKNVSNLAINISIQGAAFNIVDQFDIFWTWIKSFFVESWILAAIYCMFYCN